MLDLERETECLVQKSEEVVEEVSWRFEMDQIREGSGRSGARVAYASRRLVRGRRR